MNYSKNYLSEIGKRTGFITANLEKVIRLLDVLEFIFSRSDFREKLVLKGGTAINLAYTHFKRLSIDIDLDYHGSLEREVMLLDREIILRGLDDFMLRNGYEVSKKSRESTALISRSYRYKNASGNIDNIKVDINFLDRVSLYDSSAFDLHLFDHSLTVVVPNKEELFGMKTAALLARSKPRDVYDYLFFVDHINEFDLFRYRKAAVFYLSLDNIYSIDDASFNLIRSLNYHNIMTELTPVLSKNERFDLEQAKAKVIFTLQKVLALEADEQSYLNKLKQGEYCPELLLGKEIGERVRRHPMALWRVKSK